MSVFSFESAFGSILEADEELNASSCDNFKNSLQT